jgi:hypothetical protein
VADRYFINGGVNSNWSTSGNWSATDGGAGGAGVPTSADNAYFSNLSPNCVVDTTANCLDLDFTKGTGYTGTFSGTAELNVYGSLTLSASMTRSGTSTVRMKATSTGKTITSNGKTIYSIDFNGVGGGWTLQDALSAIVVILLTNGSVDTNGKAVSCTYATCEASTALTLGTTTLTLGSAGAGTWNMASGCTFSGASSTININCSGFFGGGKTYGTINVTNPDGNTFGGANTFTNLTITGSAVKTGSVPLSANQTVTGTFTVTPNSATNRVLIASDTLGTARTITAAAVSLGTGTMFRDITGAGAATWSSAGQLGDCLGNSGITFTPAAPQYWKTTTTGTKTWSTVGNWFLATNGGGGAGRVPLPQDNCVFDANSIGATGTTISADMPDLGKDITWTGVTNSPVFSVATSASIYGNPTYASSMSIAATAGPLNYVGRSSQTITSSGVAHAGRTNFGAGASGTYTLQDAFTCSWSQAPIIAANLTFNANGYSVVADGLNANAACTLQLGSGVWTITGTSGWSTGASTTISASTSTIKLTDATSSSKTFGSGGKTYNNLWFSGTGTGPFIVTGSPTFADLKVDAGLTVQGTAGITITSATYHIDGRSSTGTDAAYGLFDGVAGSFFNTPSSTAVQIGGATLVDIRSRYQLPSLTPTVSQMLWSKDGLTSGTRECNFYVSSTTGTLSFDWFTDGTSAGVLTAVSTATLASAVGGVKNLWLRVLMNPNNGSNRTIQFYWAVDDGTGNEPSSWTQLGSTITAATTNFFSTTANVDIGAQTSSTNRADAGARVYRSSLYKNGSSTASASFNATLFPGSGSTLTASTGEVWTRNGNAQFSADNLVTIGCTTNATFTLATTGAAFDPKYTSYRNVVATAAKMTAHYSLNGGSNSNITFTEARYWVGGTDTWSASNTTPWALGSGGAGGASVPTVTQDVEFDNHSSATAYTVTVADGTQQVANRLSFGAPPATSGVGTMQIAYSDTSIYMEDQLVDTASAMTYTAQLSASGTGYVLAGATLRPPTGRGAPSRGRPLQGRKPSFIGLPDKRVLIPREAQMRWTLEPLTLAANIEAQPSPTTLREQRRRRIIAVLEADGGNKQ